MGPEISQIFGPEILDVKDWVMFIYCNPFFQTDYEQVFVQREDPEDLDGPLLVKYLIRMSLWRKSVFSDDPIKKEGPVCCSRKTAEVSEDGAAAMTINCRCNSCPDLSKEQYSRSESHKCMNTAYWLKVNFLDVVRVLLKQRSSVTSWTSAVCAWHPNWRSSLTRHNIFFMI